MTFSVYIGFQSYAKGYSASEIGKVPGSTTEIRATLTLLAPAGPVSGLADMSENRLNAETSPYLLQHRDNPVHWWAWGDEALAMAAAENRPILLSIGYSACHWCHVMAHESFEDEATAALMNANFINIKVDREERPDLDAIYQRALGIMGQHGGWPLTMFLAPGGEPFWGGTYFPKVPGFGRPSFPEVLNAIAQVWQDEPDKVTSNQTAILGALKSLGDSAPGGALSTAEADAFAETLDREVDRRNGGLGGAPKFPQCALLDLLWRHYRRTGNQESREAVILTLERMSQGGIYDHLGGGYARYATDERWLVPHFEKMLYDNAQILDLLCHVWLDTGEPLFRARTIETADWMLREMRTPEGAFGSALDADSEGVEGKYYVWQAAEIDALLGNNAESFKAVYGVSDAGNWENTNILNRLDPPALSDAPDEESLAQCRATLLAERNTRIRPEWDDKVLADWNGLAIAALANAARIFERRNWLEAAETAFAYITSTMSGGERLNHAARAGTTKPGDFVDDYAQMARAALVLQEVTGQDDYRALAETWLDVLDRYFWDAEHGGYFFTPSDGTALVARAKLSHDNATPAGNGTLVGVLARLYHLTGNAAYRDRAEALAGAFSGAMRDTFAPLGSMLAGVEELTAATQVIIIGERGEPGSEGLIDAAYATSLPSRVLQVVDDTAGLPSTHPAHGKDRLDGTATAYVCVGERCTLPVSDSTALLRTLRDAPSGSIDLPPDTTPA